MFEGMVPMTRDPSNEEVANLTLFLGSDEQTHCNGVTLFGRWWLDSGLASDVTGCGHEVDDC